jgi:uncharacterized membrane protein
MRLMKNFKIERFELILIAILVLGFFLRIYGLDSESLWLDEGHSIDLARLEPSQMLETLSKDVHAPLYFLILHYWINLFGEAEFTLRFLSVIFGFFAIFMMYKVGSLIYDKRTGILSSLTLALSPFHIYFSQEARPYALVALLTLLSMYFFIKILEKRTIWNSIGYIVASILLMYTHVFGLFIIISQNIFIASSYLFSKKPLKPGLKEWILYQAILIVLFIPWIGILAAQALNIQNPDYVTFWIRVPTPLSVFMSFVEYSGWGFIPFLFLWIYLSIKKPKTSFYLKLKSIYNSIKGYIKKGPQNINHLLLAWLLTPILLPFAISQFLTPIYLTRYTIGASLAFYLLVAHWLTKVNRNRARSVAIALFIILSFSYLSLYFTEINKDQWRQSASYIDSNAKQGDLLLFHAGYGREGPINYYLDRKDLEKEAFPKTGYDVNEDNINELTPILESHKRVWLILFHSHDKERLINSEIRKSFTLKDYQLYDSMEYLDGVEYLFDYKIYNEIELFLFVEK